MGIKAYIANLLGITEQRATIENPQVPMSGSMLLDKAGAGINTLFGVVTAETAMRFTAVQACVRVISQSLASLPLHLYDDDKDGKARADYDPLYTLLHDSPNAIMSSFSWRECMLASCLLRGNGFSYIDRDNGGRVIGLNPLDPEHVSIGIVDGRKVYIYRDKLPIEDEDMLHFLNLTVDGLRGLSPISYARNAITLGLASEDFGARYFANGSQPAGVLEVGRKLDNNQYQRLRESFEAVHLGLKGAHRTMILEEGMKFTPTTIPNNEAQFIEVRKFQIQEIARVFGVPPHMIGDLERSTNNNIEQQSLEFVRDTLRPWIIRIEQELNRKLLGNPKGKRYFEFELDALLRGDQKSRYEAYAIGKQWGFINSDEIRAKENLNALPDGLGQVYLYPVNMGNAANLLKPPAPATGSNGTALPPAAPADSPAEEAEETAAEATDLQTLGDDDGNRTAAPAPALNAVLAALALPLVDSMARMVRKEGEALRRASNKPEAAAAVADFYAKHERTLTDALAPSFLAIATAAAALKGADSIQAQKTAEAFTAVYSRSYVQQQIEALKGTEDVETVISNRQQAINDIAAQEATKLAALIGGSND